MLRGLAGDLVDLVHRPEQLLAGRRDLVDGGGGLVGRGAVVVDGLLLLPRGGGDLGGGRQQRDARLLDPADQRAEVLRSSCGSPGAASPASPVRLAVARGRQVARGDAVGHQGGLADRPRDRPGHPAAPPTSRPRRSRHEQDATASRCWWIRANASSTVLLDHHAPAERGQVRPGGHDRNAAVVDGRPVALLALDRKLHSCRPVLAHLHSPAERGFRSCRSGATKTTSSPLRTPTRVSPVSPRPS